MNQQTLKELVGENLAARVKDGDILGVGSGTTVTAAVKAIGKKVKNEGILISAVPTSFQIAELCQECGIHVLPLEDSRYLSWGFDGADGVDSDLRLIKGKGGALVKEKIIAARCKELIIIVDESKIFSNLADACAVPVELLPAAWKTVTDALKSLGALDVERRQIKMFDKDFFYYTENGNIIFDAKFDNISNELEREINLIPGVVDNGIFTKFATEILVSSEKGIKVLK
ncbi:MAG: ribose-5-phosphate isomerase RpiA [Bdellovibrionales bacterium]|nr:ribose-5-phosphate isomerase RpiA [Bdellovibrionales bacterium]